MIRAIYPGSFDPVTNGHLDIIRRAAKVFDTVIVGVLNNVSKKSFFSVDERVNMLQEVIGDLPNVEVKAFNGLLVDFSEEMQAHVIVRGIRAVSDFEYELMMAQTNKQLNENVETMFFATNAAYSYISSSSIREIAAFGGDITDMVPESVRLRVEERYGR